MSEELHCFLLNYLRLSQAWRLIPI